MQLNNKSNKGIWMNSVLLFLNGFKFGRNRTGESSSSGIARILTTILVGSLCLVSQYSHAQAIRSSQTVTFNPLPNRTLGSGSFTVSASASSGMSMTFYSGTPSVCTETGAATINLIAAGTCEVIATQGGNVAFYSASVTQSFAVLQKQTIVFGGVAAKTFGNAPFAITGTASLSPVSLSVTPSSVCTGSGSSPVTVTIAGAGTCNVSASQAGNASYGAATGTTSFTVAKAAQSITIGTVPTKVLGNPAFTVSATASSGLAVTSFSSLSTGVCTVSGSTVTLVTSGSCVVAANQIGNANYNAAPQATTNIAVAGMPQTITFGTISYSSAQFSVTATASSGLEVTTFGSLTTQVCTVSGSTVTLITGGTCTLTADQAGNTTYAAATEAQSSFQVGGQSQTITFNAMPNVAYGSGNVALSATASSGLGVTFTSSTPGTCSVSGTTVTQVAGGSCTIAANQPGTFVFSPAPQVLQTFTITPLTQTVSISQPATVPFGTPAFSVTTSSSASLAVVVSSTTPNVCSVAGTTVTLNGVGTCGLSANQAGNADYQSATASVSFVVTDVATTAAVDSMSPPYLMNNDAGTLPGKLAVSNSGAATYSIPIAVPPGTAGMAPNLSLNYSSLAGNGISGYGWTLSGGSSIRRCVSTLAQDGYPNPINVFGSGPYCLDGNRLLVVSGNYGGAPSTYRTEIDIGARITLAKIKRITCIYCGNTRW